MSLVSVGIAAVERGLVPDVVTRAAIRRLCRSRLNELARAGADSEHASLDAFCERLRHGPIAPVPEKANEQHYELPAEFFELVLGPHRKYSCSYFADRTTTLAEAEEAALVATAENAGLADGQEVLELGCGWGSLALWMAGRFPASRITAVSNSAPQRASIEERARKRRLGNLRVITADMNDFDTKNLDTQDLDAGDFKIGDRRFDRVVSVEMFEHMHNYERLLERIAGWLRPGGRLLVHWFCHRSSPYAFGTGADDDWMGKHFFSGGLMPCEGLLSRFDRHLEVIERHRWNGDHYRRTAEAWLANLDERHAEVLAVLAGVYGRRDAPRRLERWRIFFLSVAELFGFGGGKEWFVSHQLLRLVGSGR